MFGPEFLMVEPSCLLKLPYVMVKISNVVFFLLKSGQNHMFFRKNPMFEANIQGIRSQAA